MKSEAEFWDRWYHGKPEWDVGTPEPELARIIDELRIEPCPVLEVACGSGTDAVWLAQQGFEATAADISTVALALAEEKAKAASVSVRWIAADLQKPVDLGGPYPLLVDSGGYHAIRRRSKVIDGYLDNLRRASTTGTLAILLAGSSNEPNPGPLPTVTEAEIRTELQPLFDVVRIREIQRAHIDSSRTVLFWSCLLRRRA